MTENGLTFQKYGKRLAVLIHAISKEQVESGDIESVKEIVDAAMKAVKETGKVHPWNLMIAGYGQDTRPLAQIPETAIWFRKVQGRYPFLPIFLTPFILNNYLYSQFCVLKVVHAAKKADLSVVENNKIDRMVADLNEFQPSLGDECRKQFEYNVEYKVDLNETQNLYENIRFAAKLQLGLHEIPRQVTEKVLAEGFQRIIRALEN